jgi:hypothetical protein
VAIDLQPLVDRFYDYFLDLYYKQSDAEVSGAHADTAKAGEPFLAFGGIGAVITPDMAGGWQPLHGTGNRAILRPG